MSNVDHWRTRVMGASEHWLTRSMIFSSIAGLYDGWYILAWVALAAGCLVQAMRFDGASDKAGAGRDGGGL